MTAQPVSEAYPVVPAVSSSRGAKWGALRGCRGGEGEQSWAYGSWNNVVERLFAEVTDKAIRRGAFRSVQALEAAIEAYLTSREPKPFIWTATAAAIRADIKRFCERTSGRVLPRSSASS
jgi:hypothetical protein